ncbi:MAG: hypothetical protein GEU73_12500 [Chloroflexi bacterium]|nr:hypothetical protein [Chloroflexota bacterium]
MNPNREQLFAVGVVLGVTVGLIIGSMVALRIGDEAVEAMRRTVERVIGHDDRPKFELLLQ